MLREFLEGAAVWSSIIIGAWAIIRALGQRKQAKENKKIA